MSVRPRADEAGDAEDLALGHGERGPREGAIRARQVAHLEDGAGLRPRDGGEQALQAAPHHALDHGADGGRAVGELRHALPVAQHDDPIGDPPNLLHAVRDVDDADTLGAQLAHLLEQRLGFGAPERGGGLVEDEQPGVERQRLGDLDELLLGRGQALHLARRRQVQVEPRQLFLGAPHHGGAVHAAALHRPAADEDILRDGELRQELHLLVDQHQPLVDRLARGGRGIGLPQPGHGSFGRRPRSRDDAGQGGLAGAILPEQRHDLAGVDVEVHLAQDLQGPVALRDAAERQDRFRHGAGVLRFGPIRDGWR